MFGCRGYRGTVVGVSNVHQLVSLPQQRMESVVHRVDIVWRLGSSSTAKRKWKQVFCLTKNLSAPLISLLRKEVILPLLLFVAIFNT